MIDEKATLTWMIKSFLYAQNKIIFYKCYILISYFHKIIVNNFASASYSLHN